jgi:hypothetical protein
MMANFKRTARKGSYGIGALALIAMPGILGTPYPAPRDSTATYAGISLNQGPVAGTESHVQNSDGESVIGGKPRIEY